VKLKRSVKYKTVSCSPICVTIVLVVTVSYKSVEQILAA